GRRGENVTGTSRFDALWCVDCCRAAASRPPLASGTLPIRGRRPPDGQRGTTGGCRSRPPVAPGGAPARAPRQGVGRAAGGSPDTGGDGREGEGAGAAGCCRRAGRSGDGPRQGRRVVTMLPRNSG